jgi:hypothetical protein
VTARTPDGTGSSWARGGARDWGALDPASIGRIAAQKALASRNPQTIEPGRYTAVLEAQAVTDLVPLLAPALNARTADEGRGLFSKPAEAHASASGWWMNASRSIPIQRIPDCSVSLSTPRAFHSYAWSGSKQASCATCPIPGLGAETGRAPCSC